jgi:hypothetical protein
MRRIRSTAIAATVAALLGIPAVALAVPRQIESARVPPGSASAGQLLPDGTMPNPGGSELLPGLGQPTPLTAATSTPVPMGTAPPRTMETTTMPGVQPATATPTLARTPAVGPTSTPTAVRTPDTVTSGLPTGRAAEVPYTATLIGEAEVPGPGAADGLGSAAVVVDPTLGQVCYALHVVNIAPATGAHIHEGRAGESGPVVIPFEAPSGGNSSGCVRDLDRGLLARLVENPAAFYVNVHNADFPQGAVRGQLGQ